MANRKLLSKRECDFIERHIPCMGVIAINGQVVKVKDMHLLII
jgi:hypothetical protein